MNSIENLKKVAKEVKEEREKSIHPHQPSSTHINPVKPTSTQKEREHLIKSMLEKGRPSVKQLKCGIHNEVFYFGTTLRGIYDKETTAVLTSNKEIFIDFKKLEDYFRVRGWKWVEEVEVGGRENTSIKEEFVLDSYSNEEVVEEFIGCFRS